MGLLCLPTELDGPAFGTALLLNAPAGLGVMESGFAVDVAVVVWVCGLCNKLAVEILERARREGLPPGDLAKRSASFKYQSLRIASP